jgi:tetratricopeptide (TPR) repeat protein
MRFLYVLPAIVMGIAVACVSLAPAQVRAAEVPLGDLGTASEEKIQEVTDAITRFKNADFEGALALLKTAVKKHPELPPAEVIMAQLYASANAGDQAMRSLEDAIKQAPTDPEAYVILADLALRGGRVTEAKLTYGEGKRVLDEFKGNAKRKKLISQRVNAGLASLAEAQQDWPTAQKYLEAWLAEDANNGVAMQRVGRALFQQNKADLALKQFQAAKKANEKMLTPEAVLAGLYEAAGDRENANKHMIAALTANPKDLDTRLAAAQWAFETEQYDTAKQQVDLALKLDPDSLQAKVLCGVVALFLKDYKTAEEQFQSAHVQSPSNFAASNNLALALSEQDVEAKKRKALEYADVNARANQNSAEAFSTLGWVLYRLGKVDEAEQALRKAASGGTLSADTAFYIAKVSVDRGRNKQAKDLLENALKTKRPFSKRQEAEKLLEQVK